MGGGIEAHRGGGGQIEALRLPVDGDSDHVVGESQYVGRQPPGLVPEQPGGGGIERPPRLPRPAWQGERPWGSQLSDREPAVNRQA